jgi:transcription initiation factor IIE alpha subunit
MLQEDRERERAKIQSYAQTNSANSAQLEAYRDALVAEAQDLKRQLAAAHADVEIARADTHRVMTANTNLQSALEAFQSEREAELALLEEQKLATEEATAAAHAAAIQATLEVNEAEILQIKRLADEQIIRTMEEVRKLEEKNERYRLDNVQMRRSLDEAIQRLQATQEDVIDRTLMKNILLDWLTKPNAKEKRQVLELMANVLHFTEEEKEKVHVDEGGGALERVIHSVAAPFPPSKADVEHLEGENVRDKWINFLLAETDDD